MLPDMGRQVIFLARNIMSPRDVLPDVEVGDEQIFNFRGGCVKLNPLRPGVLASTAYWGFGAHFFWREGGEVPVY